MRLKCLDMQGFKSFPDKINIGFDHGITAIVGPNGSGKSNVSDAIRWVLGEQSNKSLRSTKMEDVIFSGTAKRKPQGFAEVSLTIDNEDRALNVDYNEVMITRRYYRSGESEYFINKSPARLRDIHEMFMDTGIGRDGYSIIGQGTIDQILLGKSEERRSMLEEVAGISKFRYRKNEAERKLATTEENLIRLNDIVGELRERLPNLERQADKAKKYLAMYEEKKSLEIAIWLQELDQIKINAQKIEENHAIAKGQLDDLSIEVENMEQEINDLFQKNVDINAEIEQIRLQQSEWDEQISALNAQKAVLESQAAFEQETIARLEQELSSVNTRKEELHGRVGTHRAEIAEKEEKIREIEQQIAAVFKETESIIAKSEDQRKRAEELQEKLQANAAERNRLQMDSISLSSSMDSHHQRVAELEEAAKEQQAKIDEVVAELEAIDREQLQKAEEIESEQNARAGLKKMLEIKDRNYQEALEAEQKSAQKMDALAQREKILSEMERHLEGFGGAVKLVVEQSNRGILQGIVGPVSKLIKVEEEYLIAVETALGAAIQNIVTKDAKAAKNAMLMLKNKGAGRATFLPLNEITPKGVQEDFSDQAGFLGIADSLVKTDAANQKAIAFLLGRTLVCQTIDDALNLAKVCKNKYKIVTLDGQVINAGGSMTGGSAAKSAGLLSRGIELRRIAEELEETTKRHEELQGKLEKAAAEKATLDARLQGAEDAIHQLTEERLRLAGLYENKAVVKESYEAILEGYHREKETVLTAFGESESRLGENQKKQEVLLAEGKALEEQLTSLQGLGADDQAKMEALKAKNASFEMEKVSLFKEIEGLNSLIGQLEGQLLLIDKEEEEKAAHIEASRAKIEQAKAEAASMEEQAESLKNQHKGGKDRIDALVQSRQDYEQKQTQYRADLKSKNESKAKLIEEVTRLDHRLAGITDQSDRIIAQLLDVYELTVTEAKEVSLPLDDYAEGKRRVQSLKASIKNLGAVNIESIEEYNAVKERYDFMDGQVRDLTESKIELEKIIRELLSQMRDIFSEKFALLNSEFQKIFSELFGGGTAKLVLSDPEDVLNCDIDVKAAPPGKIIKNLVSLSGGERAFTAICLYFAILKVRPTPFCVVDEIEAALDDVNVTRFANYMRHYSDKTQFVCITHRRGTMEEADVLYGVTMPEQGISKLLTINVNEIAEQVGIEN